MSTRMSKVFGSQSWGSILVATLGTKWKDDDASRAWEMRGCSVKNSTNILCSFTPIPQSRNMNKHLNLHVLVDKSEFFR